MAYDLDYLSETLPATELRWPGASAEQLDFMRAVYDAHVARAAATHTFVPDMPAAELATIEGPFQARTAAAAACRALLAAARAAAQGLPITVGLTSAYRPAAQQLRIWQSNFPTYYRDSRSQRQGLPGGEHGPEAVQWLATRVGWWVGAPGFSNHNKGDAVDLGVHENGVTSKNDTHAPFPAQWRQTWVWNWLTANAARFDYYQNTHINEPWHWEHRPAASPPSPTESDEESAADVAVELLQAGQQGRVDLAGVRRQLAQLAQTGSIAVGDTTVVPDPALLAVLRALLAATPPPASGQPPGFSLMSMVRAQSGMHTKGRAVDIGRFAGETIVMTQPARALEGVLAVLAALPPGTYALGLPRPVRADAEGARDDHARYAYLGLYQPGSPPDGPPTLKPAYANLPKENVFLPVNTSKDIDKSPSGGNIDRDLDLIVDAPAQARLRAAVAAARQRGARISFLFPDALDHLHVHVLG